MTDFTPIFPLTFTEIAKEKLAAALADEGEGFFIRVAVKGGGCSGFTHSLELDNEIDQNDDIQICLPSKSLPMDGQPAPRLTKVITDTTSALYLEGIELDYVNEGFSEGFKFIDKVGKIKSHCACGSSVRY